MSKLKIIFVIFSILFIAAGFKVYGLFQAMNPTPIIFWQVSDEENKQTIDHQLWGNFLVKYLSHNIEKNIHEFDYKNVAVKDKEQLTQYLMYLKEIDPRKYSMDEQLAFWANLYNALTIDIVLKNYPIESIKDIGDGFTGPWNKKLITISGMNLTLNNIEHGILRGIWKDNRIHYIINCASIGCPDLPLLPLSGQNIEQQLEFGAARYINQSKGTHFMGNQLVVSNIYHSFSVDFGDTDQALLEHLKEYAKPALRAKLENFKGEIDFEYNWKLNAPH